MCLRLLLLLTLTFFVSCDDILTVATNNGCGKIVQLIQSAGLDSALKAAHGVTLFAPSDVAVRHVPADVMHALQNNVTLLTQVLKFHVTSRVTRAADVTNDLLLPTLAADGAMLRMNVYNVVENVTIHVFPLIRLHRNDTVVTAEGSPVSRTDLAADNGVVHVIDKVIYPLPAHSLPITLTFNKELGSLAYLIYQAKLTETLNNDTFTIFAPSTDAFNKLPGQVYNDLLMNITRLKEVLFTHVVKGVVFSSGLSNGQSLTNVQGTQLPIFKGVGGLLKVHGIHVSTKDTPASNGVIHILDTVIMPS